jgi:hypothetical protein
MSVNPGSFADLGKEAKEALFKSKDFNTKDQLQFTTSAPNGIKLIGKLTREASGLAGQVELKFPKGPKSGIESSVTLDTKGKSKFAAHSADKITPGLKLSGTVELQAAADESAPRRDVILTAEYKREHLFHSTKATVPFSVSGPNVSGTSVLSSTVVGLEAHGVSVGAELDYSVGESQLRGLHVVGQYKLKTFTLTGYSRQLFGAKPQHYCGALYYMRVPSSTFANAEVTGQIEYDTLKAADNTTLSLGGGGEVAPDTRVNFVATSRGSCSVILSHTLNKNAKVRLGGDLSVETGQISKSFLELQFSD